MCSTPTTAPPSGAPYAQVMVGGQAAYNTSASFLDCVNSRSQAEGVSQGRASVDLATGELKAGAQSDHTSSSFANFLGYQAEAVGVDLFTIGGLPFGTSVQVEAGIVASGLGTVFEDGQSVQALVQIQQPAIFGATDFQFGGFQARDPLIEPLALFWTEIPYPIDIAAFIAFEAIVGHRSS